MENALNNNMHTRAYFSFNSLILHVSNYCSSSAPNPGVCTKFSCLDRGVGVGVGVGAWIILLFDTNVMIDIIYVRNLNNI